MVFNVSPLRNLLPLALMLSSIISCGQNTVPDTIVINGKILTVDEEFSTVQALAILDGRIIATGETGFISALAGASTEVIDVAGATIVPGLIDNHFHFLRAVQRWHMQPRLDGVTSRSRALQIIADKVASMEAGEWVMVQGGWYSYQFADQPGGFTLAELDQVSPDNPLFLQESYSTIYANSIALNAIGLDPADGARRSAQGLVTFQPPYGSLMQQIPATSEAQLEQNLTDFMHELNRWGLTAVYSLGRGPEGEEYILERRAAKGDLPLRIWHTLTYEANNPAQADAAADLIRNSRANTFNSDYGLFGLGEHIYLPFFDFPSQAGPWPADIIDNYMKIATAAAEGGWHLHEHTMSNFSVQDLLDRYEELNLIQPMDQLRWTLAHVYDISADSIERAEALGMTLAIHGVAMHGRTPIPFRQIQDSGIVFGLGTDSTIVAHYQPFITLGWAVSGLDLAGNKALDETLSREEALIAHTRSNAYMFFQEDNLGSLEAGKFADLVVLDRDYMTIPAPEIMAIAPVMTMVGGKIVYRATESSGSE